jgi:hypothetical protein
MGIQYGRKRSHSYPVDMTPALDDGLKAAAKGFKVNREISED